MTREQADLFTERLGERFYQDRVNIVCEAITLPPGGTRCPPAYPARAAARAEARKPSPPSDSLGAIMADIERRQHERDAFRDGTAATGECTVCCRQVNAWHVVQIRLGFGLGEKTFLCGGCLDALAESLYRQCAKNGKPHWRKKPGEAR